MSDKIKNVVVAISFMAVIVILLLINIFKEQTIISTTERRKLATFPKISVESLLDKTFVNQFDKFTMDQFVQRDEFRKLKTAVELDFFKKKDVNNVYQYNGRIVKQEYPLNELSVRNVAKKMNIIIDTYLDKTNSIYYSIAPDKNYFVDSEYLKMDYSKMEQILSENLKDIKYIDIFDCLSIEDYYYTDTHWRQENLGNVLDKIATEMKFKTRLKSNLIEKEICPFQGVYSGQLQVKTNEDSIKILTNDIIDQSIVDNFETKKQTSVYDMEKIDSNDRYDIFLSGATPLLTVTNPNAKTNKKLVVFRDSFGSSLIPLFIEAYTEITIVDTRYIATSYLKDFVDFKNKDVLFLYSTLVINSSSALK